jgi:hypothetical protein
MNLTIDVKSTAVIISKEEYDELIMKAGAFEGETVGFREHCTPSGFNDYKLYNPPALISDMVKAHSKELDDFHQLRLKLLMLPDRQKRKLGADITKYLTF